jgi:predicted nucleotidyltransferase
VRLVNCRQEYAYRVEHVVLFGSMLSDTERLGDVDVAIRLEQKISDATAHEQWCTARRKAAEAIGRNFYGVLDWAMWPTQEILLQLKARSGTLSLHDFSEVEKMPNVRYRVLLGDPEQIAATIVEGQAV